MFEPQSDEYKLAMAFLGEIGERNDVVSAVRAAIRAVEVQGDDAILCPSDITHRLSNRGLWPAYVNPSWSRFWNAVYEVARYEVLCWGRPVESLAGAVDKFMADSSYF